MPVVCCPCAGSRRSDKRGNSSCVCTFAWISGGGGVKTLTKALLIGLAALVAAVAALVLAQPANAQDDSVSSVDGRIVVAPWVDDDGRLTRVEFGFRPAWGEDVRGGGDGPDDLFPTNRFLTQRLIESSAGRWLRSSEILIPDADGSEDGVRGRIIARAEVDDNGRLTRIGFGFRPGWGEDVRGEQSGGDDVFPTNRFLTRRLIDNSASKWLRSSLIAVPAERPEPTEGEVGAGGGTAVAEDGAAITVPPGAASVGAKITARVVSEEELPPLPAGGTETLGAWDFEVEGELTGTVTLSLPSPADEDETWFLAHYNGEHWILEPFTVEGDQIIVQTDSLSFWKKVKGLPVIGDVAQGLEDIGGYIVEGVTTIGEGIWDGITWTVDWGAEQLGLKDQIICEKPDDTVTVRNPSGGSLIDRIVGVYLKGCAQRTDDGPLLLARNPRHIWFEVRPIEGNPEHATSVDLYKWLSDHEGTLLAPGAVGSWRPTRDGAVRLNAEMTWTAAGMTVFYQPIKEMVEEVIGFAVPIPALTNLVSVLLRSEDLVQAFNQWDNGNREAALKTVAGVLLTPEMGEALVDLIIAAAQHAGVTIKKAALIKVYGAYKVGEKLVNGVQRGVEFFKVLIANDEERLGTVAYDVPPSVCWGGDITEGTVKGRWNHACQSQRLDGSYARYYRFELDEAQEATLGLDSEQSSAVYVSRETSRTAKPVRVFTEASDWARAEMEAGLYTIEVANRGAGQTGEFELRVELAGGEDVFQAVSAGSGHTCGLRVSGEIECWGNNSSGQRHPQPGAFKAVSAGGYTCGLRDDGTVECWGSDFSDWADAPAGRFSAISSGAWHTCGLRDDGTVECWGDNDLGQSDAPRGRFTAISAGWGQPGTWSDDTPSVHTCGLRDDGTVQCWGSNGAGQSDDPGGQFTAVSTGGSHTCGLRDDGTVECWGTISDSPNGRFTAISAGRSHTCGLRNNGTVECWGGTSDPPSGRFTAISAGTHHTCGLRDDGTVECWGRNEYGESTPKNRRFSAISASSTSTCGLRDDGTVECWGYTQYGSPDGRFIAVSTGSTGSYHGSELVSHACGLRETGTVECWGYGEFGQIDAPSGRFRDVTAGDQHTCGLRYDGTVECWGAEELPYASGDRGQADAPSGRFTAVSAGSFHTCGLRESGAIECWGTNGSGQTDAPSGRFTAVSAGGWHTCGLRENGAVECWGTNGSGQTDAPSDRFAAVSAGRGHTCGLRESGAVECWGTNGSGQTEAPSDRFAAVSAGGGHTCGLRDDGTVRCWGLLVR